MFVNKRNLHNSAGISRVDYGQLLVVFLLGFISIIALFSAENNTVYKNNFVLNQLFYYGVGAILIFFIIRIDPEYLLKYSWYMYGVMCSLLLFLRIAPESIAPTIKGIKGRWLSLAGITIQPSEFMKIVLIIMLAAIIYRYKLRTDVKTIKTDMMLFLKLFLVLILPVGLIISTDLGTAMTMCVSFLGLASLSGISWKINVPVFGTVAVIVVTILLLVSYKPDFLTKYTPLETFRLKRIYSWLDPNNTPTQDSYQLLLAIDAIGSGEIYGKGFKQRETLLPEAHSDLIFGIIAEEYGFIGASFVIFLYFVLIFLWIRVAALTTLLFNYFVCIGLIFSLAFHVFQNIGMSIRLMPITGLPLPFLSAGGSALLMNIISVGLVMGIRYHHKSFAFSVEN